MSHIQYQETWDVVSLGTSNNSYCTYELSWTAEVAAELLFIVKWYQFLHGNMMIIIYHLSKDSLPCGCIPGSLIHIWNYPTICSLTKQRVVHLSYLRKEGRKLFNACALCFGPIFSFATIYCFGSCRTLCLSERDFHLYKFYVT